MFLISNLSFKDGENSIKRVFIHLKVRLDLTLNLIKT